MSQSRLSRYVIRRSALIVPQLFVVSIVAFALVKLLPGDPARLVLGPAATTPEAVEAMRQRLGLDEPIVVQYGKYLQNIFKGDWGRSFSTQEPVLEALLRRVPSTLELVTLSLLISAVIGIIIGVIAGLRPSGLVNRILTWYGLLAGAIPDFWMGLLLIFFFFFLWGAVPAPLGQLSPDIRAPPEVTYVLPIDAIIAGHWEALKDSLLHLILPVFTLVLVYLPAVIKTTAAAVDKARNDAFITAAKVHGLKRKYYLWYIIRVSSPPTVTILGVLYVFLLGGAVLVETVFSWNGFGQFAVESVLRKDFFPIQGFILLAAAFTMIIYLIVDICYALIDPRVRF